MDPRDGPFDLVDGAECAACGRPVPAQDVRILAHRDDVAFAEVPCQACGSRSLAIFVASAPVLSGDAPGDSVESLPPIGPDDVLDMHEFLAGWRGDLRSLVLPGEGDPSPHSGAA
jgi:DNA-directed RNA polymerase subunit RPC12/RpoP